VQDYSWTFTTEAAPDTTAPRVQTVSSANLTRGVTRGINASTSTTSNSAETTMPPRTNNVLLAIPNLKASEPTSPSVLPKEGVPGVLWSVLVFGGIAAVSFTYLFGLESTWAHRLMVGTLAAVPRHFPLLPPPVAKGVEAVHGDDIPLVYAFCFLTGGEIPTDDVVADRPGGNAEGFRRNVGVDPAGTSPVVSAFLTPHAHTTPEGRVLRTVLRWGQRGERTSN
jgi:hypothetical protein